MSCLLIHLSVCGLFLTSWGIVLLQILTSTMCWYCFLSFVFFEMGYIFLVLCMPNNCELYLRLCRPLESSAEYWSFCVCRQSTSEILTLSSGLPPLGDGSNFNSVLEISAMNILVYDYYGHAWFENYAETCRGDSHLSLVYKMFAMLLWVCPHVCTSEVSFCLVLVVQISAQLSRSILCWFRSI